MNGVLNVILNVVLMLGIVGVCAFIFSVILDAIMCATDKHKGVYLNTSAKGDAVQRKDKPIKEEDVVVYRIDAPKGSEAVKFENVEKKELKLIDSTLEDGEQEIDMAKAEEEQKKLEALAKGNEQETKNFNSVSKAPELKKVENTEEDFETILDDVTKEAKKQLSANVKKPVSKANEVKEPKIEATVEDNSVQELRDEIAKLREEIKAQNTKNEGPSKVEEQNQLDANDAYAKIISDQIDFVLLL